MKDDIYFLKKTLQLAKKAEGFTSPNPLVGAVIVKNNRIITQGYHKKAGFDHAEIEAIKKVNGDLLEGATLYVNLEPCCHFGKTPPCVDEIIKNKIKRVVIAVVDSNKLVKGKSIEKLKKAGIETKAGLCEKEAKLLNEVFFKNMEAKRPFVVVKTAQSLDGKIATRGGLSKWITSEESRKFAKCLRDKYDCILVGINTIIKDNPQLNGLRKIPYKAVIDPHGRIYFNTNIIKNNPDKLILFTLKGNEKKAKKLPPSVKVFFMKKKNGWFPIKDILKILYKEGIMSIFVEGGSETQGRFFDARLVDKVYCFISPKILGGRSALSSVGGKGVFSPSAGIYIKDIELKRLGEDILVCGYPCYNALSIK